MTGLSGGRKRRSDLLVSPDKTGRQRFYHPKFLMNHGMYRMTRFKGYITFVSRTCRGVQCGSRAGRYCRHQMEVWPLFLRWIQWMQYA